MNHPSEGDMAALRWIPVTDRLPEHGQEVLIFTNEDNVFGYELRRKRMHVAEFRRGKIPGRLDVIEWTDQHGNNQRPYRWCGDGPCSWFGQEVTHWAELTPP